MSNVSLVDGHIDEPKLTDEQIKKIFDMCSSDDVVCDNNCPLIDEKNCTTYITKYALDLINRKNRAIEYLQLCYEKSEETCSKIMEHNAELLTEIERLQRHNKEYSFCNLLGNCLVYSKNLKDYNDMRKGLKSEARKGFAERLEEKAVCIPENEEHLDLDVVFVEDIDNLVKEMDGEQ